MQPPHKNQFLRYEQDLACDLYETRGQDGTQRRHVSDGDLHEDCLLARDEMPRCASQRAPQATSTVGRIHLEARLPPIGKSAADRQQPGTLGRLVDAHPTTRPHRGANPRMILATRKELERNIGIADERRRHEQERYRPHSPVDSVAKLHQESGANRSE